MIQSDSGKSLALTAIAVLISLVFGEIAVRFILPPPYRIRSRKVSAMRGMPRFSLDPQIGWINEVSDDAYHFVAKGPAGGTADAVYHIRQGRRVTSATPRFGPALITAGCSFTFGFGINDAETWPWQVQERMPAYEIVNVGTSAYGVEQSLLRADRMQAALPGKVKAIVYGFGDFHFERDRADQRDLLSLVPVGRPRVLKSGDGVQTEGLVHFWGPGLFLEHSNLLMHMVNHVADAVNRTPSEAESWEIGMRIMEDFAKRFRADGIPFGIVILPHGSDTGPKSSQIRKLVEARLLKDHIPFLVPNFPRTAEGKIDRQRFLIRSDDFHPNAEYNRLLAESVTSFVSQALIPEVHDASLR